MDICRIEFMVIKFGPICRVVANSEMTQSDRNGQIKNQQIDRESQTTVTVGA